MSDAKKQKSPKYRRMSSREGLHSQFNIKCEKCTQCSLVDTGLKNNIVSDINSSVILGAIHSGVGSTGLNKILVCTNLAQISDRLYKKYEDIIGKAIESEARERIYTLRMLCLKTRNTLNLSDEALYEELVRLFQKYASNSHKFSIAASSQSNESFNNIVANKAHKNKCLNTSAAYDIRVAAAVCAKNDGEESILNIKIKLDIPIGSRIFEFVHRSDIKRQKRSIVSQSKAKKLRRIEMKKREVLRKNTEKREVEDETNVIYFDLETTGFAADGHILQIAAICDIQVFNIYVYIKTNITTLASAVT
ncbi:hypothetical protein PV326_010206 [Microctonus aethiopoides]|nr:hypothetical protein PV326_010206 [Microctonus aethiopoides]